MTIAAAPTRGHLLRILGVAFGIAVTIGNMVGAGVLRSPSAIAGLVGSAALILLLWLAGAVQAALAANVLVELGTAVPLAGGPYVFSRRALGDVPGLIVGWSIWCAKLAGIAANAVSFASFLGLIVPPAAHHEAAIAVALLVAVFGSNMMGLRNGRALQESTSFAKTLLLAAFVLAAFVATPERGDGAVASPLFAFGWIGVVGAYKLIRGAYSGWDAAIYFSEESRAPGHSLPRALFGGLVLTSLLYLLVNAALFHTLGLSAIAHDTLPFMTVLHGVAGSFAATVFAIGAMITVLSVANANIMTAPRILLALGRDGLLPQRFAEVNDGGSPTFAFLLTGIGSVALAATGRFTLIFGLIGTLATLADLLTVVAFFALRRREPGLARPFRARGYPVLPLLALGIEAALLVLFNAADRPGFYAALALCVAAIPFAWLARRGRLDNRGGNGTGSLR